MKSIAAALILLTVAQAGVPSGSPASRLGEYALVLADPPLAEKIASRDHLKSPAAQAHLKKLATVQAPVLAELARRKIPVRTTARVLVNAIYVVTDRVTAASLAAIPGVRRVQYLPPVRRDLNTAATLVNASAAWSAVGGSGSAGAGVKIGIIDTGIDQSHPGFQDFSLRPPGGFPKGDTAYTNNKVIVARSYVPMLTLTDPTYSTPDDYSPRDRTGHGTAIAMIAAGVQNTGPLGTIQGIAPKAWLGNYKIFGSPGVNDYTYEDTIQQALTDAVNDGMDIVTLSLNEGDMAQFGPFDSQAACGDPQCDVRAQSVENAVKLGLTVVTSAGNDGNLGVRQPTRNAIHTPGTAPSAITVGATLNSHVVYQSVRYGNNTARALFADGTRVTAPITGPLRDAGLGCDPLPAGSLTGAIALVQRGNCFFADKINHAQAAGAIAVVIYQINGSEEIYPILFVQNTAIPAVLVGNTDGKALKSATTVTLDPALNFADNPSVNSVANYSSRGPSIGNFANQRDFALKPELVAPGSDLYTATQKFDPNGDTYNPSGYTGVTGTSYAVPFVAGAVALVKQKNSAINTPARLKSAVVNTTNNGLLNLSDAINTAATFDPAAISFGPATTLPISRTVTVSNVSSASATFSFASTPPVTVTPSSITLGPGAGGAITVALTGSRPSPGAYESSIAVTGAGPTLHLPYAYYAGDGVPYNIFPVIGGGFTGFPNDTGFRLALRLTDQYGVPVTNYPITFRPATGGGKVETGSSFTDVIGTAAWFVDLGSNLGSQTFVATAGGLTQEFDGFAVPKPGIQKNGIVNAATFQLGAGIAPGSYISLFGTNLADTTSVETTPYLPVSLASVAVSFDAGSISVPGHLHFVSPGQINVQVPWELQGQPNVKVKITQGVFYPSDTMTVPLATYSPGIFAITGSQTRGGTIVIYANGLGPVDIQPASGDPTPSILPLANTKAQPTVTIGGANAQVLFSGLTPASIGLYQVNVTIPTNAPTGAQSLKLSIGGQDVTVNIQIQ